jgi:hypothetical protein
MASFAIGSKLRLRPDRHVSPGIIAIQEIEWSKSGVCFKRFAPQVREVRNGHLHKLDACPGVPRNACGKHGSSYYPAKLGNGRESSDLGKFVQ